MVVPVAELESNMLLSIVSILVLAWVVRVIGQAFVSLCACQFSKVICQRCSFLLLNGQHHADLPNTPDCKFFSNSKDLDYLVQVCFNLGLELDSAGQ